MSEQTTEKAHLFLSLREASLALCFDFRHYEPQLLLFCELIRLMSDGNTLFRREADKNGLWISQPGRRKMRWIEGSELIEYMCEAVSSEDLSPDMPQPFAPGYSGPGQHQRNIRIPGKQAFASTRAWSPSAADNAGSAAEIWITGMH
ncbi:hypothetical protein D3OALGB2SA_3239 [Olavius algarvensis associated proteobacterium Delta 3]|nr:hypothetical protein D3OALGB2SA_3239 [Olavius algarvensis associated proteobacterium Delta 3]